MYRILFATLLLAGCTTALWAPNYEQQWVNGFYLNQQTNELVVTTRHKAYIFPIESYFAEAILLTRHFDFYPSFEDFKVNDKSQVTGRVSLTLIEPNPPEQLESKIKALGFKNDELIKKYRLSREISGTLFTIEGELPLEKLENEYPIAIAQLTTFVETAGKIVATPATITIDAVTTIPSVFLAATVMTIASP